MDQEQPPCCNRKPPHDISGSTPLDNLCETNHSMGAVQDAVHGPGGHVI